jgi:hypothetical protein
VEGKNMAGDNVIASMMHSSTDSMQPLHMACRGRAGDVVCRSTSFDCVVAYVAQVPTLAVSAGAHGSRLCTPSYGALSLLLVVLWVVVVAVAFCASCRHVRLASA